MRSVGLVPEASPRRLAWILFAVALVLRVGAVFAVQHYLDEIAHRKYVIEGDADGYWQLAHHIVKGEPYQIYTPPRAVLRMPGFPLLLAGSIWAFGDSLFAARLVLATIGALGCVGVYWLGYRLVSPRVGLIASGLAAVSPIFVGFSAIELTETAFAVAMVFGLIPMVESRTLTPSPSPGRGEQARAIVAGLVAGVLAGVGVYLRPSWLLFPPLLAAWLYLFPTAHCPLPTAPSSPSPPSRRLTLLVALIAGLFASLLPWALRNQRVTGHFVLTTLWMGPSLYDGWNPEANGDSNMIFFDRENVLSSMSEYEMDRHYRARAWQFAGENPGRVIELAWIKTLRYWNPLPNAEQFRQSAALKLVSLAWYLVVFIPALIGTWKCRKNLGLLAICGGPIIYFAALHLCFVSSVRYRLPGEYSLLILSAVGWQVIVPALRSQSAGLATE